MFREGLFYTRNGNATTSPTRNNVGVLSARGRARARILLRMWLVTILISSGCAELPGHARGLLFGPVPPPPSRLTVRGSRLYDPSGGSIRLTGFNWVPKQSPGALELRDAAWSATLGSNVARIVGVLWKNRKAGKDRELWDCATEEPPHFFNDSSFALVGLH